MSYIHQLNSLKHPSFDAIRNIAVKEISALSQNRKDELWNQLNRGTALLQTDEQMSQYLFSYGNMHQAKLLDSFRYLPQDAFEKEIEIVDWGCGQAMGTVNLFDHLKGLNFFERVKKVTLIEPSAVALERAVAHVNIYTDENTEVVGIADYFENLSSKIISANPERNVLHIFSNILDVVEIDLKHLANLIDDSVVSNNYLICVGPLNPTNQRLDAFFRYFDDDLIDDIHQFESANFLDRNWTYKSRIYKLEKNDKGHLIPIEYYPTVQFHASYELDLIKDLRKTDPMSYLESLNHFETAAPFDLGASVYDDVHPILAVLNNIICRGLPTKSSIFIEEQFKNAFGLSEKQMQYGEIKYVNISDFDGKGTVDLYRKIVDGDSKLLEGDLVKLQVLLSPIAIARFQKVLIEAIITGHISLESAEWKILVEEKDVPFAHIAIEDFKNTFNHLTNLTKQYAELTLPNIELSVISNDDFYDSKLQGENVYRKVTSDLRSIEYDLVVTHSVFKTASTDIESFSEFKVKNNCYFNIRSSSSKFSERVIYTSDLIQYKNLVEKNPEGNYIENEEAKSDLTYFLQLFFRKESFRPGQLPILDRALQNLPVIGLLPTGGGKSLTYQISALIQPGVTMIIDPLKSLMKDQCDGLLNSGIDCVAYINSSLNSREREMREKQLESSQLLFVFMSPERLSIANFRERLKNMHDYNVYFSYGVIDEVHCVSEWGHDFRFSYLHLGRNLYNYVRAKEKEISLFGLTATASFDVLADVERELSGNNSFVLDADVIVRYENTNRLELQYKIEKVPVEFEADQYYDQRNLVADHLPKALNISNHWKAFDSKSDFLKDYVKQVPKYLNELQADKQINFIKENYIDRQNNDEGTDVDLRIEMNSDFYVATKEYKSSGIIFCPHVNSTGVSVNKNRLSLQKNGIVDVVSFSGKDNDDDAMKAMETFRNNKSPVMVATKAFGMGIDKPNVRFTINMNYSSSLESFVQEAGRAGRDRKVALSTILVSDYSLIKISNSYKVLTHPVQLLKNKWFHNDDLKQILKYYNLTIPEEFLEYADPSKDIVKLHCVIDNKMFAYNECDFTCSEFTRCSLRKVTAETKGWKSEAELLQDLKSQSLKISKKNFQFLNADYQAVMFFFNESFKGDVIEKKFMDNLLNKADMFVGEYLKNIETIETKGFLSSLLTSELNKTIVVFIPYSEEDSTDLSKAIYRMTCIELIEDFTQDYSKNQFRIITRRKSPNEYFAGLKRFLLRYYTDERANLEIEKVKGIVLKDRDLNPISTEIYKCLSYLTEFVYDKISEKRKRAIDDMRNFCLEGLNEETTWIERNETLKDFIYYYFNSKFAKSDYIADNGEPFSLVEDTEGGKKSSTEILQKYIRVIDDDIVGVGTPLDNVKHLYGAVRLISRSLTDSNPALNLLEVFCLSYMGTKKNLNLEKQLFLRYSEGMLEFSKRSSEQTDFWVMFNHFNDTVKDYLDEEKIEILKEETSLIIHATQFQGIKNKYLETHE